MSSHQPRSRVPAGVTTGGQFAAQARNEATVNLGVPRTRAKVTVTGSPGPNAAAYADGLSCVHGAPDITLDVKVDEADGQFQATATVFDREYVIETPPQRRAFEAYAAERPYTRDSGLTGDLEVSLPTVLVNLARADAAAKARVAVERQVREESVGASTPITAYPTSLRRGLDGAVTELGFDLPDGHYKVTVTGNRTSGRGVGEVAAGPLTARSATKGEMPHALSIRQSENRVEKILAAVSPDPDVAEGAVRRYLALASREVDARMAADPLLAADRTDPLYGS